MIFSIVEISDYLYWLIEQFIFLCIWRKLKKQYITFPRDKYIIESKRVHVSMGNFRLRVRVYDVQGVQIIYPYPLEYDKKLPVLFFRYSTVNV